ncbi:dihydrodipicolinate synthase family protein [Rhizobium sp. SSA_523]|uniref:dihydrodipicolinate synthase family protein n=1 Tax=Rhizobium sp. SSA_523 TaxID=2952477 RepID=UPI0020901239|nr:dihydrodipicolinate synthase family protein [Rhizobium sp. SSA_523]MCO5733363.1 dihydrodipicolinate synthase family protein [Rhizobium sp. SSA_523]MCO5733371.1 dihydrodipicolinate synthase family protein [Rhizobium sp. SSA_523]WKC21653.1 dihydrodipicolinate synthase family protein [Rhizobium sp. SSA_523]WKC21660.1 dihydrodipicolinate synthase family protein [Rhizobium sp. SSA_523]
MASAPQLFGIIPPTTTPFDANGDIIFDQFKTQIRFMLESGVHGICVGGSSAEGHTLEMSELQALLETAAETLAGKAPLIAGVIINSTRQAVDRCKMAARAGSVALQVTPPHYVFRPSDDAIVDHFKAIAGESGLPVLIYNVVPWCYLSPALLIRIMKEVPGVIGVKQSNGDLKLLADLLQEVPEGKLVFTAVDALLYPSFALGAHGTIAANPAAAPAAVVKLWDLVQAGDHVAALALHRKLLTFWNALICDDLPACIKYAQSLQGVPLALPRAPMRMPDEARKRRIAAAFEGLDVPFKAAA